jgi:hypothetical protein
MLMMPANAADLSAAMRVIEVGYPTIAPVMRDMVRWMRVAESPVADAFAAFFGCLGVAAVGVIGEGLRKDNCWLKHRIFTKILPAWPADAVRPLTNDLTMTATHPDAYDNDLRSMVVLIQHRLADPKWLREWLSFKKERLAARSTLLIGVEEQLKTVL